MDVDPEEETMYENERGNWLHFQPFGTDDDEEYMELVRKFPGADVPKQTVYMWLRGMVQLVEAVDKGDLVLSLPPNIIGRTNARHAMFLEQWGFAITDLGEDVDPCRRYANSVEYTDLRNRLIASFETERVQNLFAFGQNRYEDALKKANTYLSSRSNQSNYFWPWYFKKYGINAL